MNGLRERLGLPTPPEVHAAHVRLGHRSFNCEECLRPTPERPEPPEWVKRMHRGAVPRGIDSGGLG